MDEVATTHLAIRSCWVANSHTCREVHGVDIALEGRGSMTKGWWPSPQRHTG